MEQPEAKSKGGPWSRLTIPQAVVLAALITAAALMLGNRYYFQPSSEVGTFWPTWRFDRLTGQVAMCVASGGDDERPYCVSGGSPPPASNPTPGE